MKTGDAVTDGQGRTWTVGEMLGRGPWGASWHLRDSNGREFVMKVAFHKRDLPTDSLAERWAEASSAAISEQVELLLQERLPFLPKLEAQITSKTGQPGYVIPRYTTTLKRRLSSGLPLSEAIGALLQLIRLLEETGTRVHGNLRPSNLLFNDRGELLLSDVATPHGIAARKLMVGFDREDFLPAEATDASIATPGWDSWAICMMLYVATVSLPVTREARREEKMVLPREGLDKIELAALRDRVLARLKEDQSNPRFAPRLAERFGALLNRGLSGQHEPSPPYRFESPTVLRPRLNEVVELIDPKVDELGHFLLAPAAKNNVFQGPEVAAFSVTIACSPGVSGHEDVACGLQVANLDASGDEARVPVREARYTVKPHPSGRLRFDFVLPELPPGRYRANVAFTVKDGVGEPRIASGDFEVRPPPGYVPPAPQQEPKQGQVVPLPISRRTPEPMAIRPVVHSSPALAVIDPPGPASIDEFPTPIAPSEIREAEPQLSHPANTSQIASPKLAPPLDVNTEVSQADPSDPPTQPPPSIFLPRPTMPPPKPPRELGDHPTRPSEIPAWGRTVDWDDVSQEVARDGYLPGPQGGEDLPGWEATGAKPTSISALQTWAERAFEWLRRDLYTAFMILLIVAAGLLIGVVWILK